MSTLQEEIYWTAGFLDGEGSFTLCERDPRVSAVQAEPDPLDKLLMLYGGKIYPKKIAGFGKKPVRYWMLGGSRAIALMMTLFPLMSTRRKGQITKVILLWKSRAAGHGVHHHGVKINNEEAVIAVKRVLDGESMSSVANDLGISHATISFWMKGGNRPEIRTLLGSRTDEIKESSTGQNHYRVTIDDNAALAAMQRVQNGESMYSVGHSLGVTPETVSFWMRGLKRPYLLAQLTQEEAQPQGGK